MTEFWIIAGLMTVVALGFLAWPILRARDRSGRWSGGAIVAALLLAPLAVLLYRNVTTWTGTEAAPAVDQAQLAIVEQLAARMQQTPDDVEGWMLLGRSYLTLQQFVPARQAFMQAWQRTPNPGNDLKLALGIAMVHSDRTAITGEGGKLIEDVVASEPRNQQALWYGGMVAYERGRGDLARDRWTRLLTLGPPPEVARVIEQQLAMLGGSAPNGAGSAAPGEGGATAATGSAQSGASGTSDPAPSAATPPRGAAGQQAPGAAASDGPVIRISVELGDGVSTAQLGPNAALFIFARAQAGGPPLAVMRQPASAIPGEFTLSNANTMIQGNSLDNFDELTIVARLSASGQPTESPGDIYAQTTYDTSAGGDVALTLDQIVR